MSVFGINFIYVVLDDFLEGIEGAEIFHYGFTDNFVLVVYGPFDFDFCEFAEEVIYIIVAERADFIATGEEQGSIDFHRGIGEGRCGQEEYIFLIVVAVDVFGDCKHFDGTAGRIAIAKSGKF